jgi:NADPH:quinone reductase-like Zn-dependent oxidoreductase
MRAVVCTRPGPPEVLELRDIPAPEPLAGHVLIRVRAFGLNRAELFTRQGDSPGVTFPRVLGIECTGEVIAAPGTDLEPGQRVAAMMGGMGRQYDGSYAEVTRVPRAHVFPLQTDLPWEVLGALPEMFQTTQGSLTVGLDLQPGDRLLIRGGTSSIGLTAAVLAKQQGAVVLSTSRTEDKADLLRQAGVDQVVIDDGRIAKRVRSMVSQGVHKVLELIGTTTLADSLQCTRPGGVVCMTGILGGQWVWPDFEPMAHIPTGVRLTAYSGGSGDVTLEALQGFVDAVAEGRTPVHAGHVYRLDEVPQAHRDMEANQGRGKLVVRVDDT